MQEMLDYLYSLRNQGSSFGIERMELLLGKLGSDLLSFPVIHVAGTNGKGSTCAMLDAIYQANGYKVGLFSSPHLVELGDVKLSICVVDAQDGVAPLRLRRDVKALGGHLAKAQEGLKLSLHTRGSNAGPWHRGDVGYQRDRCEEVPASKCLYTPRSATCRIHRAG